MKDALAQDTQDEIKEAQRAYYREWTRKNPEKVKANRARFWARQAERRKGGGASDS